MYIAHFTVYIAHCTVYIAHCTMQTHHTPHSVAQLHHTATLYPPNCTLSCTLCLALCALHCVHCTLCALDCVHCTQCAMHTAVGQIREGCSAVLQWTSMIVQCTRAQCLPNVNAKCNVAAAAAGQLESWLIKAVLMLQLYEGNAPPALLTLPTVILQLIGRLRTMSELNNIPPIHITIFSIFSSSKRPQRICLKTVPMWQIS